LSIDANGVLSATGGSSVFSLNGTNAYYNNGNVGIGTTNPQTILNIAKSGDPKLRIAGTDSKDTAGIQLLESTNTATNYGCELLYDGDVNIFKINMFNGGSVVNAFNMNRTNGYVGLGMTASSSYRLDVSGNIRCTTLYQTSDKRLKNNIQNLNSVLDLINGVNPVSFNIENDNKTKYGFIAQELENIIPDIVNTPNDDDDYYCVDYVSMIPLLTKSTQELHKIIMEQENKIMEQENKIMEQENKINKLEEILARNGIV
jgi:hypothetical protein